MTAQASPGNNEDRTSAKARVGTESNRPEGGRQATGPDYLDSVGRNKDALDSLLTRVHEIVKDVGTRRASMSRLASWLLFLFMFVIVTGTGFLVYVDKVSDGAFTFLVGVMIGAMIQFLGRLNLGSEE